MGNKNAFGNGLALSQYYFRRGFSTSIKAYANGRNKCQQLPTLLGVVGLQCCARLHGPKSLTGFKLYATSANIVVVPCKRTQQVATLLGPTMLSVVGIVVVPCKRTQQVATLLGPTMLGVVGQQCWVRLHGPLQLQMCACKYFFVNFYITKEIDTRHRTYW